MADATDNQKNTQYFAEDSFIGADLTRKVHIGFGVAGGIAAVFFCLGMSAATQSRSFNVSFRWLQRRVGAQFATMSYLISSNMLFYHNGEKWVVKDWAKFPLLE